MKKTVSIILITVLAVSSIIGVSAYLTTRHSADDAARQLETRPVATQKVLETQTATTAQTKTENTTTTNSNEADNTSNQSSAQSSEQDDNSMSIINFCFRNISNPDHCSIEVKNQYGNTVEFTITSSNESYSKIATADITVTFDNIDYFGVPYGVESFEYTDSFGSSGTGEIDFNSSRTILTINQEYSSGLGWDISNASGKFM